LTYNLTTDDSLLALGNLAGNADALGGKAFGQSVDEDTMSEGLVSPSGTVLRGRIEEDDEFQQAGHMHLFRTYWLDRDAPWYKADDPKAFYTGIDYVIGLFETRIQDRLP